MTLGSIEPLYCIRHEYSTLKQNSDAGICHSYLSYYDGLVEVDWCSYDLGWAYVEPPEFDDDWDLNLQEPSDEELSEMDECAERMLEYI